jgi:hypothetical protein
MLATDHCRKRNGTFAAISRTLRSSRGGIPPDLPAVLVCVYPSAWFAKHDDSLAAFPDVAKDFFRSTQRVNAVVFMTDEKVPLGEDQGVIANPRCVGLNPTARFPVSLEFLTIHSPFTPHLEGFRQTGQIDQAASRYIATDFELYRWAESIGVKVRW